MVVRPERAGDFDAIGEIHIEAFRGHPFSRQTEHRIVEGLRAENALELSLVAEVDGMVVGHIAFSAAGIGETTDGLYLLGPVGVRPEFQGRGIGRALIEEGLGTLRSRAARGCVLVGDPAFYQRFGFRSCSTIRCDGVPNENVLFLPIQGEVPTGALWHHPAFSVEA